MFQKYKDALAVLALSQGTRRGTMSPKLERIAMNDIVMSLRGEIFRFNGEFESARDSFLQLLQQVPMPPKVTTQLSAVYCELCKLRCCHSYSIGRAGCRWECSGEVRRAEPRNAWSWPLGGCISHEKLSVLGCLPTRGRWRWRDDFWKTSRRRTSERVGKLQKVGKMNRFGTLVRTCHCGTCTRSFHAVPSSAGRSSGGVRVCWPERPH